MPSLWYLQLASTFISLAVGVGIAWGAMRATITKLSDKTDKLDEIVQDMRPMISQMSTIGNKVDKLTEQVADIRVEIAGYSAIIEKE